MPTPGLRRRLVLVRHAKSKYPYGVPDHERPLAGKGMRNAQATATWFVGEGPDPELVICSDAVRARQTWQIIAAGLSHEVTLEVEPRLYGASAADVISLARAVPANVSTVVMVGHEPTMSDAVSLLAGPGSNQDALTRINTKYPTNGVAVLALTSSWATLEARRAILERFEVPRA